MRFQLTVRLATFALVILLCFPLFAPAQAVRNFTLKQGTNTSAPINLIGSGVNLHQFNWNTVGTISAGACALLASADGVTFGTTLIAAQTVTSSGGPTAVTSATTVNYVEISCTTPLMGTGSVTFHYAGAVSSAASVSVGSVTVSGINANVAAGTNGTAVPGYSSLTGVNVGGNTVGVTGTGTSMNVTAISGSTTAVTSLPALPTGTNTIGSVNLGTLNGAATAANQATANTALSNIDSATSRLTSGSGAVGGGSTLGTTFVLGGGEYHSTPLTLTDTKQAELQLDANGYLKVSGSLAGYAQGSTTSGQTGGLTQCAVTTAAPSYTNAQTSPCSLDTSGQLRITGTVSAGGVAQGSTTSGQTGGLTQAAVTTSAPSYTNAQTSPLSLDTAGALRVTNAGVATSANQATEITSLGTIATNSGTLAGAIGSGKSLVNLQQINGTTITAQSIGASVLSTAGSALVVDNVNYYGDGTPMLKTDTGAQNATQLLGVALVANPCATQTPKAFSVTTAAASSTVVAAVNLQKPYLCDYKINTADAAGAFVTVVAGTGTTGATAHDVFVGSAANNATDGWFLAVSGGGFVAMGGGVPAAWGSTAGDDIVLFTNGKKVNISGHYVHQGVFDWGWRFLIGLTSLSLFGWNRRRV